MTKIVTKYNHWHVSWELDDVSYKAGDKCVTSPHDKNVWNRKRFDGSFWQGVGGKADNEAAAMLWLVRDRT